MCRCSSPHASQTSTTSSTLSHSWLRLQMGMALILSLGCGQVLSQTQPPPTTTAPVRLPAIGPKAAPKNNIALPRLGEAGALDIDEERRLGDRIAQQIYRDPDLLDDWVLQDYVTSLWQPLQTAARQHGDIPPELAERFAWQLFLSRERSINAFALPGGYFGIHVGLLAQVGSADELASVLAHELSHVTQKHISRLIAKQDQQQVWMIGAMILGALAASAAKNPDVAQAAIVGSQAVGAQMQLNFSRDMEREADRLGYTLLTEAGFDGQGFVAMFDRLSQASRHNDDGAFPYLRSHPLTTERMADMKARIGIGVQTPPTASVGVWNHALMAARARVWAEPDAVRWREWVDHAQRLTSAPRAKTDTPSTWGERYAGAFAAWRLQQFGAAWRLAYGLWQQAPQQPSTLPMLRALLLELASHPTARAQMPPELHTDFIPKLVRPALQANGRASVLWASQVLIQHQSHAQQADDDITSVAERLRWWVADHPKDATAWQLLATVWRLTQQPLRALRAEAESKAAMLDWSGAVDRLRSAQDWMRDHPHSDLIEQQIIDTRYRELHQRLQDDLRDRAAKP